MHHTTRHDLIRRDATRPPPTSVDESSVPVLLFGKTRRLSGPPRPVLVLMMLILGSLFVLWPLSPFPSLSSSPPSASSFPCRSANHVHVHFHVPPCFPVLISTSVRTPRHCLPCHSVPSLLFLFFFSSFFLFFLTGCVCTQSC
ncbi:hypothetical protein BC831DRAFT_456111 [Entophlyctis helioformis]|nr:hypothetical protein BC831DRAFT_456111 [Entophlyctis helioformis]